jgi:hypothetical protein
MSGYYLMNIAFDAATFTLVVRIAKRKEGTRIGRLQPIRKKPKIAVLKTYWMIEVIGNSNGGIR